MPHQFKDDDRVTIKAPSSAFDGRTGHIEDDRLDDDTQITWVFVDGVERLIPFALTELVKEA